MSTGFVAVGWLGREFTPDFLFIVLRTNITALQGTYLNGPNSPVPTSLMSTALPLYVEGLVFFVVPLSEQ